VLRGMDVLFLIRMLMMTAMVRSPPQWPLLKSGTTDPCQDELKKSTGLIGLVGEIAMKAGSDCKHTDSIQRKAQHCSLPGNACEEGQQTGYMKSKERQTLQVVDSMVRRRLRPSHNYASTHEKPHETRYEKLMHQTRGDLDRTHWGLNWKENQGTKKTRSWQAN